MIEINIQNSVCQIENLKSDLKSLLFTELSYCDQNISYSFNKNLREINRLDGMLNNSAIDCDVPSIRKQMKRLEHINNGLKKKLYIKLFNGHEFPTGLLPRVIKILEDENLKYTLNDTRIKPKKNQHKLILKKSLPPLRYYQKTANRMLVERDRGIVVMPTGTGKTLTICRMIWELGMKTLIITPSKAITDLMVDTMVDHFGKGKVQKLTTKSVKTKIINVINIQALIRLNPNLFKDIGACFIDEFHHAAAETYREADRKHLKHCYHRIGMTATNFRNDGADIALESVLSGVLYTYTVQQALADGYLCPPEFIKVENEVDPGSNFQHEYKQGIVQNEDRNALIADLAEQHKNDHVIILVQQIPHGENLRDLIPGSVFIHGTEKDKIRKKALKDFKDGRINCLIGTSVIGEGVDLPIADTLLMAGGGKSKIQVIQNVGRVLRTFPGKDKALIYDFTDEGSNWLESHSEERHNIYDTHYAYDPDYANAIT